jgi:hypothetical protein
MIYAASTRYTPDIGIIDLALHKRNRTFQRMHHDGVEIYTTTPSYTLAAGGIRAPQAATLQLGPVPLPFARTDDLGTGVPTSLIPHGTKDVNRLAFMRFDGVVEDIGDTGTDPNDTVTFGFGKDGRTYDNNTCVWRGFACGINYQDADNLKSCFQPGLDNAPPEWSFFHSKACDATKDSPPFFIARFLLPCTNSDSKCLPDRKFGFFEAVDAPTVTFDAFRRQVVADNRIVFPGNPSPFDAVNQNGHYRMFGGGRERVLFSVVANRADPRLTGVLGFGNEPIRSVPDWPLAEGSVLNSAGDGIIRFTNSNIGGTVIWDFSDAQRPKRTP